VTLPHSAHCAHAWHTLTPPGCRNAQPNVAGIILAGSADFKTELSQSDLFDIRRVVARAPFGVCDRAAL
jgi:hypothetical protein